MDLNLKDGDGQRIKNLTYSGSGVAVGDSDNISITGCQRLPIEFEGILCAYDGFTNVDPYTGFLSAGETLTALDLFVDALGSNAFNGNRSSITITDADPEPHWPEQGTEFIQPLEGVGSSDPAQDGDDCGFFGMCGGGGGFGGGSVFGFGF